MSTELSSTALRSWVQVLVAEDSATPAVSQAFAQLRTLFEQLTEIDGYSRDAAYQAQVTAAQGVAISINQTVRCFHDERRTRLFLQAIVRAIRDQQAKRPGLTIQVCYAGCGPYAPFCTLVAPLFSPEEVQFTLLEINELSLDVARKLISRLDLSAYVRSSQQADAVTHRFAEGEDFHILFSETLDAVLHRECFVPILLNLLPQLSPTIMLIPENVILRASLVNQADFPTGLSDVRNPAARYPEQEIGVVFNVRQALTPYLKGQAKPEVFPGCSFHFPEALNYDYLVIYTEVQVYQELWLHRGESLLTEPLLREVRKLLSGPELHFQYQLSPQITLEVQ